MMTVESTVLEMEENQKSQNEIVAIPVQENIVLPISLKKTESTFSRIERITYFIIKRVFDILCSIFGILMLIPISLVTKICYIAVGDKKSIFYKQKRVGKNGKIIYIYKFRSMVYNADEVLNELLKDPKYRKDSLLCAWCISE